MPKMPEDAGRVTLCADCGTEIPWGKTYCHGCGTSRMGKLYREQAERKGTAGEIVIGLLLIVGALCAIGGLSSMEKAAPLLPIALSLIGIAVEWLIIRSAVLSALLERDRRGSRGP